MEFELVSVSMEHEISFIRLQSHMAANDVLVLSEACSVTAHFSVLPHLPVCPYIPQCPILCVLLIVLHELK